MEVIQGNKPPERKSTPRRAIIEKRRKLLAVIHIAKKELGLDDETYEGILIEQFHLKSASAMSPNEMRKLIEHFEKLGWKSRKKTLEQKAKDQTKVLRDRALGMAKKLKGDWMGRLRGVCRGVCGTEELSWIHEADHLKRIIAILGSLVRAEKGDK